MPAATKNGKRSARADGGLVPAILGYCETQQDIWAWRTNSGTLPVTNRDGSIRYVTLGESGTPDILGVLLTTNSRSIFFGIEAKRRGINKKRRESQVKWHDKAAVFGVSVCTTDTISDVIIFLNYLRTT